MPKALLSKKTKRPPKRELTFYGKEISPLELIEREREFLSEELHDTISQSLSGLTIMISFLQGRFEKGHSISKAELHELRKEIHRAADDLKILTFTLQPKNLQGGGLILALSELVNFTTQFHPCEFECKKAVFVSSPERAFALFRIAQEALRCTTYNESQKTVKVKLSQVDSEVVLEVSPFMMEKAGKKVTPRLIELYCRHINGGIEFKQRTSTLICKAGNI